MVATERTSSVELPLTPAHRVAVRHHVNGLRQFPLGAMAGVMVFAVARGLAPDQLSAGLGTTVGLTLGLFLLAVWADYLIWRRPAEVELERGVFFRASGPIRVSYEGKNTGTIHVGDVRVRYVDTSIATKIRELPLGTVDYLPGTRIVLEQRDADDALVYRHPKFRPEAPDTLGPEPSIRKAIAWGAGISAAIALAGAVIAVLSGLPR